MKFLIRAELDLDATNEVIRTGKATNMIRDLLEEFQPDNAYFFASGGKRTVLMVIDLEDASHIARIAEPWFQAFKAKVQFTPVMTIEDLEAAGTAINEAIEKYQ